MSRRFRPPWWSWLLLLPLLGLLCGLGSWQLRRAHEKERLLANFAAASRQARVELRVDSAAPADAMSVAARAHGRYLGDKQLLLDNQSHRGQPGRDVWTPLRLDSGGLLLVNRGWVPLPMDPSHAPAPAAPGETLEVQGLWRALPRPGLRLAKRETAPPANFPVVVEYPTSDDLQKLLGEPVAPGILLLDAGQPHGFVRDWNPVGEFPPARHYAYAVQWFALAATLAFLFVRANLKKSS